LRSRTISTFPYPAGKPAASKRSCAGPAAAGYWARHASVPVRLDGASWLINQASLHGAIV
jgi:hypothetical protein